MKKEVLKTRFLELLSDLYDLLIIDIFLPAFPVAVIYCLPALVCLSGFSKVAYVSFVVLLCLYGVFSVYLLVKFIRARREDGANEMNRCLFTWLSFSVAVIVGVIATKTVGVFL